MAGFTTDGGGTLAPERTEADRERQRSAETPWVTVVWDDPVNLMSYVTYVFQKLLGHSKAKAHAADDGRALEGPRRRRRRAAASRWSTTPPGCRRPGSWATVQQD